MNSQKTLLRKYLANTLFGCIVVASLPPRLRAAALAGLTRSVGLSFRSTTQKAVSGIGKLALYSEVKARSTLTRLLTSRHYCIGSNHAMTPSEVKVFALLKTSYQRSEWVSMCKHVVYSEQRLQQSSWKQSRQQLEKTRSLYFWTLTMQDAMARRLCEEVSASCPLAFKS